MQLTPGDPAMTTRSANASNEKALDSFLATKARIDQMLARIQTLSDDHFNTDPDAVHWGDVGTLSHYSSLLRQITDIAFKEGEHAA
jgi:1-deoxy-D-xylulose 5-phosphate reductoisomerase